MRWEETRRRNGFSKPHGLVKSLPRTNKGLEKPLIQVQLIPVLQSAGSRTTRNSTRQYIALRYKDLFEPTRFKHFRDRWPPVQRLILDFLRGKRFIVTKDGKKRS